MGWKEIQNNNNNKLVLSLKIILYIRCTSDKLFLLIEIE